MAADAPPPFTDFNKLSMSTTSMNEWFENADISTFLTQDVVMDLQQPQIEVPTASPDNGFSFPTPSPEVFYPSDSSAYSSDSSESHSPFDQYSTDSINSGMYQFTLLRGGAQDNSPIDEALFEPLNFSDPLLVPEIEKILAANPYQLESICVTVPEVSQTTSKKRQREASDSKTPVTLARDQLLTMTSKEIEDYVSELKSKRTLTSAEEKDLKRQRRLVKNREYASQSRSRKKQFMDDLEKQLEAAKAETEQYKKHNQTLVEENKILKRQLGSIADTIKKVQQNGSGSANLSASSGNVGVFDRFLKVGSGRSSSAAPKGVSACVLAIFFMVFTFAAFWDNDPRLNNDVSKINFKGTRSPLSCDDTSMWEAAFSYLRQTWEATSESLPTWDSAYTNFIAAYPIFFSPSSSDSSTILPIKQTQPTESIPTKPCQNNPDGECDTHPPPASLPETNKTHRCGLSS